MGLIPKKYVAPVGKTSLKILLGK
jgi:hypothetical protein